MKRVIFIILIVSLLIIINYQFRINNQKDLLDGIVYIKTYKNQKLLKDGTGFVYKRNDLCYILTNYHVISDYEKVTVGNLKLEKEARILNYSEYYDIAILTIDKNFVRQALNFGSLDNHKSGDEISIYTFDYNKNQKKVEQATINNVKKALKFEYNNKFKMLDMLVFNSHIDAGNSGSPILDNNYKVIGMVTMMDNNDHSTSYAIPVDELKNIVALLEQRKQVNINLGIEASTYNDNNISGIILNDVYSDYPFFKAGLNKNDIIVKINNDDIKDIVEFRYYVYKNQNNNYINLQYLRDGSYNSTKVYLR